MQSPDYDQRTTITADNLTVTAPDLTDKLDTIIGELGNLDQTVSNINNSADIDTAPITGRLDSLKDALDSHIAYLSGVEGSTLTSIQQAIQRGTSAFQNSLASLESLLAEVDININQNLASGKRSPTSQSGA